MPVHPEKAAADGATFSTSATAVGAKSAFR
jgi:hypothetical protein